MKRRRLFKFLGITAGIAVVVGVPVGWRTWDYIQNDPEFCTSCHIMDDAHGRWAESAHRDVNCHTCHPGDLASNAHQVWVQLTQRPDQVKKHAEVPPEICGQCHLSGDPRWKQIEATAGHALHFGELGIQCVTCHAPEIHAFRLTNAMCKGCHTDVTVGLTAMGEVHCTSCHPFLAPKDQGLITTGEACGRCHTQALDAPPVIDAGWHGSMTCGACHPVHDFTDPLLEAPLRDGAARPCDECHEDEADRFVPPPNGHDRCADCHVPHEPVSTEERCRTCHATVAARLPFDAQHGCSDCHVPHAADVDPRTRCADCHRTPEQLRRETPVAEHRECANCHEPHAPEAPDAPACARCHTAQARANRLAAPDGHQRCGDCHRVHAPERPRTCQSCHGQPVPAAAPAEHRDCASCHRTHGSPAAGDGSCATCHDEQVTGAREGPPEHGRCTECHTPHRPDPAPVGTCATCHAERAHEAAGEPEGHRPCTTCHADHDRRPRPSPALCVDCHDEQAATGRLPDEHTDCTGCHAPHRVDPRGACATCHAGPAAAVGAARWPEHADCAGCHGEAHGPPRTGPAACGDCHADTVARGLHAHPDHGDCATCHGDHPPRRPPARACLNCHDARSIRRHPPEARGVTTCSGCHNFRGAGGGP